MRPNYKVYLILVTILIFYKIDLSFSNPKIEIQIGPFKLSDPAFTDSKLVSDLGEGCVQVGMIGNKIISKKHIFWVPEQNVWLQISFSHVLNEKMERNVEAILVTKNKLCEKEKIFTIRKKIALLATSKGIKINDSIDKVIQKYGKPSISKAIGKDKVFTVLDEELELKGGTVLRYLQEHPSKDMNFVEFYFSQERLHSFLISESE